MAFLCLIVFFGCKRNQSDKISEKDTVLRISDVPFLDTSGKQSIFHEISPYAAKGIDPPEGNDDDEDKPYNRFEFIQNAHSMLKQFNFDVGNVIEFSNSLLNDTVWAKTVYDTLAVYSTKRYLGTKKAFLDSLKRSKIILMAMPHTGNKLKFIEGLSR